jgi:hypothetical protein
VRPTAGEVHESIARKFKAQLGGQLQEILSMAIFEPVAGEEANAISTLREIMSALSSKGLSRDFLYRTGADSKEYVLFRYWKSDEARRAALEDPEILRGWAKLAHEVRILKVYESIEQVETHGKGHGF